MKHHVRHALRRVGYDLVKRAPNLNDFLQSRSVDVVLDVGANIGQFGLWLRRRGYRGRIVSFEPVFSDYTKLCKRAAADRHWETKNLALGDVNGERLINVSKQSEFSSLLPLAAGATQLYEEASNVRQQLVKVVQLDDVFDPYASSRCLLKVDTQGYEQQVLRGGIKTLPRLLGVQLELSIAHLYADTWMMAEAIEFMDRHGFVLSQIEAVNYLPNDPVSMVEVDALFRRKE